MLLDRQFFLLSKKYQDNQSLHTYIQNLEQSNTLYIGNTDEEASLVFWVFYWRMQMLRKTTNNKNIKIIYDYSFIFINRNKQAKYFIPYNQLSMKTYTEDQHSAQMSNPGFSYVYRIWVYQNIVRIHYDRSQNGCYGECILPYKIQDGKIQWEGHKKYSDYKSGDNLRIIKYLRNLSIDYLNYWMHPRKKLALMPFEILQRLEQIQGQQISKQCLFQKKMVLQKRRRQMFAKTQRKQIDQGSLECIFCTILLIPSKFQQLKCGHCFHRNCIRKYCLNIKNQCPICKYSPNRQT